MLFNPVCILRFTVCITEKCEQAEHWTQITVRPSIHRADKGCCHLHSFTLIFYSKRCPRLCLNARRIFSAMFQLNLWNSGFQNRRNNMAWTSVATIWSLNSLKLWLPLNRRECLQLPVPIDRVSFCPNILNSAWNAKQLIQHHSPMTFWHSTNHH